MARITRGILALSLVLGSLVLGSLGLGGAAAAQTAPRTLSMTGQGTVRAAPDQVEISAGVTTEAATAAAALAANTKSMTGLFAALEKLGVPARDIQTRNISVSPQYANAPNAAPRLTGYRVDNQVHVVLEDVSRLGMALDALVQGGANRMNGLDFSIRDDAALLARARADAVADARAKAQQYAAAAGLTLGPILSLSEGGGEAPRPMFRAFATAASAPVPVAAGEESVAASVSIVWEIQ